MCYQICQLLGFAVLPQEQRVTLLLHSDVESRALNRANCAVIQRVILVSDTCKLTQTPQEFFALWKPFGKAGLKFPEDGLF